MPRIAIAGSVNSSLRTLHKLLEHKCNLVGVLGLDPKFSKNVSGYNDLKKIALENEVPFRYFHKINDPSIVRFIEELEIDFLFVIGLSQLISPKLIQKAKIGNIGFHPTRLPKGRGRAAVPWMILGKSPGAATFFMIDEGMDSGPILGQSEYEIFSKDYAQDVIDRILEHIDLVLDELLPKLNSGKLILLEQDHKIASYLGQRKPIDGRIDWTKSATEIHRLIRASSRPYPGAYSEKNGNKVVIYRASVEKKIPYFGVPGRIIKIDSVKNILVACGDGAIWLDEYQLIDSEMLLKVGLDI